MDQTSNNTRVVALGLFIGFSVVVGVLAAIPLTLLYMACGLYCRYYAERLRDRDNSRRENQSERVEWLRGYKRRDLGIIDVEVEIMDNDKVYKNRAGHFKRIPRDRIYSRGEIKALANKYRSKRG